MTQTHGNGNGSAATIEAIRDATTYPFLTENLNGAYGGSSASPVGGQPPGTSAPLGRIVDGALRDVLAWRPRSSDSKGFVSALTQAFNLRDVEGHVEWDWIPRTYAVDAELGAVTGAQASIYARAKAFLAQALPLLEGLKPLRADFDDEDTEAVQAIVENGLTELIGELGQEGGPRVTRVDQLFTLLLGQDQNPDDPEDVAGQLGLLKGRFGLDREAVNTIAEEEVLTNFLILVDGVRALAHSWESQRRFFERTGTSVFLGTQSVQLSRALAVIAESVQEAYCIMDSVYLGPAERQITPLKLRDVHGKRAKKIFLGELLSWVHDFASEEGPRLIRDGGKDGVVHAFVPTINQLSRLAEAAAKLADSKSGNPTHAFHTPRVCLALKEIETHCKTAARLAGPLKRTPPEITGIKPAAGKTGQVVAIEISGSYLPTDDPVVTLRRDDTDEIIVAKVVGEPTDSAIQAEVDLRNQQGDSRWSVVVVDPVDEIEATLDSAFLVYKPAADTSPRISHVRTPKAGKLALQLFGDLEDVHTAEAKLVWDESGDDDDDDDEETTTAVGDENDDDDVGVVVLKANGGSLKRPPDGSVVASFAPGGPVKGFDQRTADVMITVIDTDSRRSAPFLLKKPERTAFLKALLSSWRDRK